MASFLISYDLHKVRNYQPLYDKLDEWGAVRLLESVWLANMTGTAGAIRDVLAGLGDDDDSFAVIELKKGSRWATRRAKKSGNDFLRANL